jgi:hypothetical protein
MPNTTSTTHRFQVQSLTSRPIAVITPAEATSILGSSVELSATASTVDGKYSTDFEFTWEVSAPDSSTVVSLIDVDGNGSKVRLDGDVTGTYVVTLVVTYQGIDSDPVTAGVFFSPVIVPAVKRVPPPGTFMFSVLSDFWSLVNDRDVFPVLWSGYTQIVASDLLRALQIDRAKSIATIQELYQKRFIEISPELELDSTQVDMIFGNHQSGSSAFTGQISFVGTGVTVSPTEFLLLTSINDSAVGTELTLYSGSNQGTYLINRLNSSGNGFIISESTPFTNYAASILVSGVDLVSTDSDVLFSVAVDFAASGVVANDVLKIKTGVNAGYYRVLAVGTADGLVSDKHIQLDKDIPASSNMTFSVFQGARSSYLKVDSAITDVVYIPKDDADLDSYEKETLTSTGGEIVSDYEIIVSPRHVVDFALDKKITITTGTIGGSSFTIAGFNASRTGFVVTEPFSVSSFPETVSYSIDIEASVSDRLLVLDGIGHDIASVTLLEGLPSVDEGGRGDLWAINLSSPTAPARRESMEWRIGSTITYGAVDDLAAYGVSSGDLFKLEVYRTDIEKSAILYCTVTGVRANQFSFELGQDPLVSGSYGMLTAENTDDIAAMLSIPQVTVSDVTGEAIYTSSAFDIYAYLTSKSFSSTYFGYPLDAETEVNIDDFFSVLIRPTSIVRNTAIALDPEEEQEDGPVFSIPTIYEYLSPEQYTEQADGTYRLVHKDGSVSTLQQEPLKLVENINYTISSPILEGASAATATGSATITFSDLNPVANDIRPGDTVELLTGNSQGVYVIADITSSATVRVGGRTVDDALPVSTETGVQYRVTRQDKGIYLRFTESFTPLDPIPGIMWAPLVLLDNFKYIEDNFGVLVGLSRDDLEQFGTTQISYKSAVMGLMYSWATGPTFRSIETGAHILLDAPVSETLGEIIEIDDDYLETRGRITIEDLTDEGEGTGIYRTYLYPNDVEFNLERFKGLGINPETGAVFEVGDTVLPFTALSNSVVLIDRIQEPGWWQLYGAATGADELKKYHSWQAEIDLLTVDSRDIPLVAAFLDNIRPIYTKPNVVGVLTLQDSVYIEDSLFIDIDVFFFDDPAFSRESSHIVDSVNESGVSHRLLDFGSFSTRTLFRGDDLEVDIDVDPTIVTSARGGFVSGSLNDDGEAVLPYINSYFDEEVRIRGNAFVRVGDVLYIADGKNRGRFLVSEVISDTQLRIEQYVDSVPRGIDPTTHMRSDSESSFHIQRYEDELVDNGSEISSVGATDNVIVVDDATFLSNGVTGDDVLIITDGANRGIYHIEDLGEYNLVSELFDDEETTLTLREDLPDTGDLAHPFEIRRRALLENPSFTATDGETTAGSAFIVSASDPDLAYIKKDDTLTPTTGTDAGVVFRVIGVSGDTIHTDLTFTATESSVEFTVSHLAFESDEPDSDYRLERLHAFDYLEVNLYRPVTLIHSGSFTLTDDGTAADPVSQAQDEAATDLTALATPVTEGDLFEVEYVSPDPVTTTSVSHGTYEITAVSTDTVSLASYFPGVVLSSASLLDPSDPEYSAAVVPETGVAANIYTPDANFNLNGDTVSLASLLSSSLEDLGIVPGDFFEDAYGTEYLIIGVSSSILTLAEDSGLTETMTGRIFRREFP